MKNMITYRSPHSRLGVFALVIGLFAATTALAQPVIQGLLYKFGSSPDGQNPYGSVVVGVGGALFGTTLNGGQDGSGTVFKINPDGSGYAVLHSFTNSPDGASPYASLVEGSDGMLYGTTYYGGTTNQGYSTAIGNGSGYGVVFKISPYGNDYAILHTFTNAPDGVNPFAGLIQASDGMLYGTTLAGGTANLGMAFRMNTDGSDYQILRSFTNTPDGAEPAGRLLQASDGMLYGTTQGGGNGEGGTIFKMSPDGSNYQILDSLVAGGSDGFSLQSGLIQGSDGELYGIASSSGFYGTESPPYPGTIFMISTNGTGFTVLHTFVGGSDGAVPYGTLTQGLGNALYGTTYAGGTNVLGTIFEINLGGGGYNVLYDFSYANGEYPSCTLVPGTASDGSGVFYGTTLGGGTGNGTVFALTVNPALTITPVTSQTTSNLTTVFWPAWAWNYTLQSNTNLNSTNWVNVTNSVPVMGAQVISTNPAVFYRLIAP